MSYEVEMPQVTPSVRTTRVFHGYKYETRFCLAAGRELPLELADDYERRLKLRLVQIELEAEL